MRLHRTERPDVLIVGAGAAGAAAAHRLSRAGVDVVCLEQGAWPQSSAFPSDKLEWELLTAGPWSPNPNVRTRAEDYPCDTSSSDMAPLMFNAVGGSTVIFAGQWPRLLPCDFRHKMLYGTQDDWPLAYSDLVPYYESVAQVVGVSGLGGDPAFPPGPDPPLESLPINELGRIAARGMNKLGWHWWPGPNAIASRPYKGLSRCARWGTCQSGCPEGAKASVDLTLWPEAIRHGARLITGARVREILLDRRGRAAGAIYIDRKGMEQRQPASVVILAANAIGTSRILLMSSSPSHPNGLANSSGLVGRRLMTHPYAGVVGVYDDEFESWMGPFGHAIHSLQFYETDLRRAFDGGAKWAAMPTGGPLALSALEPKRVLADHHALMRELMGHSFVWGIMAEDLPDEANRVILSDELTDSDGLPAARIVYRTSENTARLLQFHLERAAAAHEASGATRTIIVPLSKEHGYHLMGTARMGTDAANSVTDSYGRTHDVPNLFIFDGSVFVTSGAMNPTATITAVAARAADHLVQNAPNQRVAA